LPTLCFRADRLMIRRLFALALSAPPLAVQALLRRADRIIAGG